MAADRVFLVDVDNTLLDNDRFQDDLKAHIAGQWGEAARDHYWALQEALFRTLGYRDYLGACQTFRLEQPDDGRRLWLAAFILDYPYETLLYPGAHDVLARLRGIGPTVLLTDGDAVFQPNKLRRSGLLEAVGGELMLPVHKEHELDAIERRYPARRYVMVDDKLRILTAVKNAWGDRVVTVFPRQGQFARDPAVLAANPPADISLAAIGDLATQALPA
ncbi:MAG: HAD family hydrolase [Caulobacteraceae bacterium]|nr:HAD family hydrolase [Caulobacter sp.]